MPTLVYLSGPPGVGKTTLMRALTAGCTRHLERKPFAHEWLLGPDGQVLGVELGRSRGVFSGTDMLARDVQPKAVEWLYRPPLEPLVLAEGWRLEYLRFLVHAERAGYRVVLVSVQLSPEQLEARWAGRDHQQSASWRAGRASTSARLASKWLSHGGQTVFLAATQPPHVLAAELRRDVPALAALPIPQEDQ